MSRITECALFVSGCYATLINADISPRTKYKWLAMAGSAGEGNEDPSTGFVYEPAPYLDRVCEFADGKNAQQVAVVNNSWGNYAYNVECKCKQTTSLNRNEFKFSNYLSVVCFCF